MMKRLCLSVAVGSIVLGFLACGHRAYAGTAAPEQAPLFVGGEGGYHTYRIPALLVTAKGIVLAFCEGRRNNGKDRGDIDLLLKRSTDHGRTWSGTQVVWGEEGETTIGNPCPVQNTSTGTVWLGFCRNNDRVFVTQSDDHGVSWATPREITANVKREGWTWYATGPVHGIQLESGRLLMPCDHEREGDGTKYSHAIHSDDHGKTWTLGGIVGYRNGECAAVQTIDGRVHMNTRCYFGKHRRGVAWSDDGGDTWTEVGAAEQLVEPVCQASVARLSGSGDGRETRILFSNPASEQRKNMTVRLSYDECRTWSSGKVLYPGPSAYSDLAVTQDGAILCLYERGMETPYETITLARFGLDWLEPRPETPVP